MNNDQPLGLPNYGPWYVNVSSEQNANIELLKINQFIKQILNSIFPDIIKCEFINYGNTQLVYVATISNYKQFTLLVTQPAISTGIGKIEFDNLQKLSSKHSNVINPICYFKSDIYNKELYITPYYFQSRCIGVETTKWGMWVPEPDYYFTNFTIQDKNIINSSMIALLIKLYDEELKQGIVETSLDGGDFMLEKSFEQSSITYENILKKMKLIAARRLLNIELNDYINLIRLELSGKSLKNKLAGQELRQVFDESEIEDGIALGLKLRENNN
jgi:hypothetical protein